MGVKSSKLSKEFHTQKIIGYGAFGVVLQSVYKFDNVAYAIKLIKFTENDGEKVLREAKNYAVIPSHQNVVSYKCSWLDIINSNEMTHLMKLREKFPDTKALDLTSEDRILCIQMELCSQNLRTYLWSCLVDNDLEDYKSHPEAEMHLNVPKHLQIFQQLTLGLRHLHKYGIIHRDLKPENIFFCKGDRTVVKIGDMGISKITEFSNSRMTRVGTPHYMPLEQFTSSYDKEVDLYALGLILVELFIPQSQFQFPSTMMEILGREIIPPEFDKKFPKLAELARKLTSVKPEERPSYNIILKTVGNCRRQLFKLRPPQGTNTNHGVKCSKCCKTIKGLRHRCFTCADIDYCQSCYSENKLPSSSSAICKMEAHHFFEVICCKMCKKDLNTGRVFAYCACNQESKTSYCKASYCSECLDTDKDHARMKHEVDKVVVDEFGQELDRYSINDNYSTITRRRPTKNKSELCDLLLSIAVNAEEVEGTTECSNSRFFVTR